MVLFPTPIDSTWADGYALSHLVAHVLKSQNLLEPSGIIQQLLEAQRSEDPLIGISQLSLALEIARGKLGLVVEGTPEQIVKELRQEAGLIEGEEESRAGERSMEGEEGSGGKEGGKQNSPLAKLVFQLQVASEAAANVAAATSTAGGEGAGTTRDSSKDSSKETSNGLEEEVPKDCPSASKSGEAIHAGASASGNSPHLGARELSNGASMEGEEVSSVRIRHNSVASSVSALTVDSSEGSLGVGKKGSSAAQKRLPKSKLQVIVQKQNDLKETLTVLAHTNPGKEKDEELIKKWNEVITEKDRLLREQLEKTKRENTKRNSDDVRGSCSIM